MVSFANKNKNFRYPTGKMNEVVYSVRGGFEDWAYSGSWEGSPIITNGCTPDSYKGYDASKSKYDEKYLEATKALSILLETSESKIPNDYFLGNYFLNIKNK